MEGFTSSSQARNEPGLTPGEQRILALLEGWGPRLERLEQGQQRMEQRLERLEHRVRALEEKVGFLTGDVQMLTIRLESEAAASKQRERRLSEDLHRLREEAHGREAQLRDSWFKELQGMRVEVKERFDQHNTRLELLEQAVQRLGEQLTAAIQRAWAPLPTA